MWFDNWFVTSYRSVLWWSHLTLLFAFLLVIIVTFNLCLRFFISFVIAGIIWIKLDLSWLSWLGKTLAFTFILTIILDVLDNEDCHQRPNHNRSNDEVHKKGIVQTFGIKEWVLANMVMTLVGLNFVYFVHYFGRWLY